MAVLCNDMGLLKTYFIDSKIHSNFRDLLIDFGSNPRCKSGLHLVRDVKVILQTNVL